MSRSVPRQPVAVEIYLPSILRQATGGRTAVTVEASTFQGCLDALLAEYPLVRPHVFDDAGALREHVNIFLNDQNSRWLETLEVPVSTGDTITVLQAVSGGSIRRESRRTRRGASC